jgi:outer membrane receptor for ferrienterochelin and colicins
MKNSIIIILWMLSYQLVVAQTATIIGQITCDSKPIKNATITLQGNTYTSISDSMGNYLLPNTFIGNYLLKVSCIGYLKYNENIFVKNSDTILKNIAITSLSNSLNEVVVTGTQKLTKRLESPVNVEVFSPAYFKKNPTPSIYEALQNVNGVRPQLNCNVCNTGDIHINGLEGPYTMVLIDGMPIVSGLSTVYGLSGIPNALVERIEIVKGPASSLYGSEAVGGLINIITKKPTSASKFSVDIFGTSWQEINADLGFKFNVGKKVVALTGINYFNFNKIVDVNQDNFTDMTLQNRFSAFQKWNFIRKENRLFTLAIRAMAEDRWGGDTRWNKNFRGGDSIYGESIYTNRYELLGNYQLPAKEKLMLSFSVNSHNQDSRYGTTSYIAQQNIGFAQLTWDRKLGKNDLLAGTALRYTFYDDNTPATASIDTINQISIPQKTWLPGIFVQDEIAIAHNQKILLGARYDYNSAHGNIFTPRIAYKYAINDNNIIRLNAGTGFRVVNIFTEDHASLTGARSVEIKNELQPEKSYNVNLNYIKKIYTMKNIFFGVDGSAFYTYFNNRIVADYVKNPNKIIYDNIDGYAVSKGITLNVDASFTNGLKIIAGGTYMENTLTKAGITTQQLLTEKFTGTWAVSYPIRKWHLALDYTGNFYGPMTLPTLGSLDPRKTTSPWWSIQNIQMVYSKFRNIEMYGGVKNLLNWTPFKENNPFIIAGSKDPFDKNVVFDGNGKAIPTANNPYGLTFDVNYIYAPTQGARFFMGIRYSVK